MHNLCRIMTIIAPAILVASPGIAGEMNYRPMNPSFGGNSNNGAYLYNLATAQNGHKEASPEMPNLRRDPLETFKETLTSRMLGAMTNQIVDSMYGENAQNSGTYSVGDMVINFQRENGQLVVDIVDNATGSQTTIQLPSVQGTGG